MSLDSTARIIELTWRGFAAQAVLPTGFHKADLDVRIAPHLDGLITTLHGYVLEDQGGKPVVEKRTVSRKVRPRWIPRRLWDRIPSEGKTLTLRAEPKWTYPSSTIKVPDLKPAVQFVVKDVNETPWPSDPINPT